MEKTKTILYAFDSLVSNDRNSLNITGEIPNINLALEQITLTANLNDENNQDLKTKTISDLYLVISLYRNGKYLLWHTEETLKANIVKQQAYYHYPINNSPLIRQTDLIYIDVSKPIIYGEMLLQEQKLSLIPVDTEQGAIPADSKLNQL